MKSDSMTKEGLILQQERERRLFEPVIALSRPKILKGNWTKEEDAKLIEVQALYGNKWAKILRFFPCRTKRSIRHRCFKIKATAAKISKAIKANVTVIKSSPSPKLFTVREEKFCSHLMRHTSAVQTASNSNVKLMESPGMRSKTEAVNSLRHKNMKKIATSESCLASKHTSQKTENVQQSAKSSYVGQGLVHKHLDNNALFLDKLNNHIDATNRVMVNYSENSASPYTSAHHMNHSKENILNKNLGNKIPCGSTKSTSTITHYGEGNNISPAFDPESFAHAIAYATSLINS